MVGDSRHREKTFIIDKNFQNQEKNCGIHKNISESKKKKKKMKLRKQLRNRGKKKNLKSRKIFQNREIICYKNREKSFQLNVSTTFLHNSLIACARLGTVNSCFAQNVSPVGSEYHFCSTCGHKARSELTN